MIRLAAPADVPVILQLVQELATYEREPEAVLATEADLYEALFGADAVASCQVALIGEQVVGFALWYRTFSTFSTWQGTPGLWLEDLYVRPQARGAGLGKALLVELARTAVSRGWTRFECGCWTGTSRHGASTARSAPAPRTPGRSGGSTATR